MHDNNAMDFDDLLVRTVNLLELFGDVRERLPAPVPARARRRVPGHEPRPVPAPAAADGGAAATCSSSATIFRASTASAPPTSATSSTSRRTSRRDDGQARAELPLDADDPRRLQRADRQQPRSDAEGAVDRRRARREGDDRRAPGRARGGPLGRRRDRPPGRGRGDPADRGRGLLPDERAEPGARGHARPLRRALPGDRRHQVLRAGRDQGRGRLSDAARQPRRHRLARPDHQHAAPRHRPDLGGADALLREHGRREPARGAARARERAQPRRRRGQGDEPLRRADRLAARAGRSARAASPSCSRRC